MNETLTPGEAARILTDTSRYEDNLVQRTEGLTAIIWGLVTPAIWTSYGFADAMGGLTMMASTFINADVTNQLGLENPPNISPGRRGFPSFQFTSGANRPVKIKNHCSQHCWKKFNHRSTQMDTDNLIQLNPMECGGRAQRRPRFASSTRPRSYTPNGSSNPNRSTVLPLLAEGCPALRSAFGKGGG